MAASGTFKRNTRQARNVTVEDSFSNGVYVSDTPIAPGYSRALVNYRIDNNTKRLVNRPGLEKIYKEPYTFYLDSVNESCFITDNHLLSLDNTDNLQYVTGFVNIDTNNYFIEPSYLGYNSKIAYANLKEDISFLVEDVNNKTINLTKTDTTDKHFIKRDYKTKIILGPEQGIYVHSCFSKPFSPLPKTIEAVVQNKYVSVAQYKSNADVEYIVKDNKKLAKLNYYTMISTESKLNSFEKGTLLYAETVISENDTLKDYWYICLEDINYAVCYTLNNILTVASTQDEDIKILCLKEHAEPIEHFSGVNYRTRNQVMELGTHIVDETNKLWFAMSFDDMFSYPFFAAFYCIDLGSTYALALAMIYPSTHNNPFYESSYDKIELQMGGLNTAADYVNFTKADIKDWRTVKCANDSLTISIAIFNNKRLTDQNGITKSSTMSDWLHIVQKYGDDWAKTIGMPLITYSQVTGVLNSIANNIDKNITTNTLPIIKDKLNNIPITFSKAIRYGDYYNYNYKNSNLIALSNIDLTDNWTYNVFANCDNIGYKATVNSAIIKKDTFSTTSESIVAVIENNTNSTICCVSDTEAACKLIGYLDSEKDNGLELITNKLLINNMNYFYSYLVPKQEGSSYNASDLFTAGVLNFTAASYEKAITDFINRFNASGANLNSCIYRIEYNKPNNMFDIKLYTPYTPTPTIAVNTGYNMLLNNPYAFANKEASVFAINGCTFYNNKDVIKIQLTPGEEVLGRIYYTTPIGCEYSIKVQYRTKEKDIYIPITTINKTIETSLPDLTFNFVVPNEDFYIFIEVTEIYKDSNSKIIYEVELPYSVKTSNITYLDSPPNYDLGTAQGIVTWKSRLYLWGVNNAPNIIFASDVLYPVEYFPYPNNTIEYDEPVLHVIEFLDSLLVFTEQHIYQTKLNSDGITWTTNTVAGNINFTPSDIYSIVPIKNMLFYKSGDYYYMLVPSTSYVTLGELKVARISEPINNFLSDFYNKMKNIIVTMYPNLKDAEYIPTFYSVFVDGDVVKINYGFKTSNSINFIFVLNYDTLNRLWYFDIINMPYSGTLRQYRQNLLGESYYSYIAPDVNKTSDKNNNFKLYLLKYINNANDFYNPVTNALPTRQFYDSGYKDINPEWKKRFREVQFKVSQPDSKRLYFKPNFILDEENRLQNKNYVLQLIEGGDYIYAPAEEYTAYGQATLEPSDEEYFLELGGENFDSHKFNLLRCKVSGKGYYPRFQIVGDNQIPYEIHNINWVFRNMNLR